MKVCEWCNCYDWLSNFLIDKIVILKFILKIKIKLNKIWLIYWAWSINSFILIIDIVRLSIILMSYLNKNLK